MEDPAQVPAVQTRRCGAPRIRGRPLCWLPAEVAHAQPRQLHTRTTTSGCGVSYGHLTRIRAHLWVEPHAPLDHGLTSSAASSHYSSSYRSLFFHFRETRCFLSGEETYSFRRRLPCRPIRRHTQTVAAEQTSFTSGTHPPRLLPVTTCHVSPKIGITLSLLFMTRLY